MPDPAPMTDPWVPRAALEDALEGMEDMYSYVPPYFRDKWFHGEYIERARAVLSHEPDPTAEAVAAREAENLRHANELMDRLGLPRLDP